MNETNKVLWSFAGPRLEMNNTGGADKHRYALRISDLNPAAGIVCPMKSAHCADRV